MPFLCLEVQLGGPHLDDGEFRGDKKAIEKNQKKCEKNIEYHKNGRAACITALK